MSSQPTKRLFEAQKLRTRPQKVRCQERIHPWKASQVRALVRNPLLRGRPLLGGLAGNLLGTVLESPMPDADDLHQRVDAALREVLDPEIGLDVVALGLVYGVQVRGGHVHVQLTMTTPACPLGDHIVSDAERRLRALEGVSDVHVELVWEPPWTPDRMSAQAKESLGWSR